MTLIEILTAINLFCGPNLQTMGYSGSGRQICEESAWRCIDLTRKKNLKCGRGFTDPDTILRFIESCEKTAFEKCFRSQ